jgi:catechol 2,3-dioxygenase-like lactoylglutathione lyase family enzyme
VQLADDIQHERERQMTKIEPTYLCPLLQVFSMRRALAFYRDILGFEVVSDSGGGDDSSWVWVRLGGCDLMLNDQYEPGRVPDECPPERLRWHGDTCLYIGCADVDEVYELLRSKDIRLNPPEDARYGMRQLYLSDPDNYSICFQHPVENAG